MSRPIVARVTKQTDDYLKDAEYGFESDAAARKVLGEGNYTIDRYQSGEVYEAPKPKSEKKDS